MVNKICIGLFVCCFFFESYAQISQGGVPYSFQKSMPQSDIATIRTPAVSNAQLLLEAEVEKDKRDGFVFGKEYEVDYNLLNSGTWETLPDGDRLWRLGISSEDAYSINLAFDYFFLPEGASLFIYTKEKDYLLGAFTEKNNSAERKFATTLLPGSEIVLEYFEPYHVKNQGAIHLSTIIHGYKDFFFKRSVYGQSDYCNININCDEGADYQTIKRSTALILNKSSSHCSGTLINNTKQDETPYFLTAYHCLAGKDPSYFVFIFNYEIVDCESDQAASYSSLNGATLLAQGQNSDFALLLLNDTPPLSYNPYYAGWDKTDVAATYVAAIHHPNGDYKKISLFYSTVVSSSYEPPPDDTHWEVTAWDKGTTEGGSSGCGLFNKKKQLVGQLEGGTASCEHLSGYDVFGKIAYSWTNNNAELSQNRLKDWLDPLNLNPDTLGGYDPCLTNYALDVNLKEILSPTTSACQYPLKFKIKIENRGTDTLKSVDIYYQLNNEEPVLYPWTGSLVFGAEDVITLASLDEFTEDIHYFTVWCENPNQLLDENTANDTATVWFTFTRGKMFTWDIKTDFNPEQTSWVLKKDDGTVLATNPEPLTMSSYYKDSFCLDKGCYDFIIYDTHGDGLNSSSQKGYYHIYIHSENINRNVDFGYQDSIRFCVDSTTSIQVVHPQKYEVKIYPNPSNGMVNIFIPSENNDVFEGKIYSSQGKEIFSTTLFSGDNSLNLFALKKGVYIVKIQNKKYSSVHKLTIQ